MEKQPSFSRIIGGTEKERKTLELDASARAGMSQKELFGELLTDPTEEETYAIQIAADNANHLSAYYGGSREVNSKQVSILKQDSRETRSNTKSKHQAFFEPFTQAIGITRDKSTAILAESAFHEFLHAASYQSAQLHKDGESTVYRSGLKMVGRSLEYKYFSQGQEAIIAILSRRFFEQVVANDSHYEREIERTAYIKDWLRSYARRTKETVEDRERIMGNIDEILVFPNNEVIHKLLRESDKDDDYKFGVIEGYYEEDIRSKHIFHERREERELLNGIMDRIVIAGKGKIKKNELFDEFARAHFTGNYLPLARTIEGILGKGSFREIATELGTGDEVETSEK